MKRALGQGGPNPDRPSAVSQPIFLPQASPGYRQELLDPSSLCSPSKRKYRDHWGPTWVLGRSNCPNCSKQRQWPSQTPDPWPHFYTSSGPTNTLPREVPLPYQRIHFPLESLKASLPGLSAKGPCCCPQLLSMPPESTMSNQLASCPTWQSLLDSVQEENLVSDLQNMYV
jgi:hypothetical protein